MQLISKPRKHQIFYLLQNQDNLLMSLSHFKVIATSHLIEKFNP